MVFNFFFGSSTYYSCGWLLTFIEENGSNDIAM